MYLYITKYSHVPFLKNPMFFSNQVQSLAEIENVHGRNKFS